jgi:predicted PhzF superfamily epimerase YddE/YHI9
VKQKAFVVNAFAKTGFGGNSATVDPILDQQVSKRQIISYTYV